MVSKLQFDSNFCFYTNVKPLMHLLQQVVQVYIGSQHGTQGFSIFTYILMVKRSLSFVKRGFSLILFVEMSEIDRGTKDKLQNLLRELEVSFSLILEYTNVIFTTISSCFGSDVFTSFLSSVNIKSDSSSFFPLYNSLRSFRLPYVDSS